MYAAIPEAIAALQQGSFIIAVDDASRENEGDLILAAQFVTEEKLAFMLRYTSGILCLPLTKQRCRELQLQRMVVHNTDRFNTPFTVSIDAKNGISSGVSAHDRCVTIKTAIAPDTSDRDLVRPGHVFPLAAADDGVFERAGHTEAAVDLCKLAGLYPAAVIAEVMDEHGKVSQGETLQTFAKQYNIALVKIQDLIVWRRNHAGSHPLASAQAQPVVIKNEQTSLPTAYGLFDLITYEEPAQQKTHLALVKGNASIENQEPILVRIHSECLTGDVFQSQRCDCGEQFKQALRLIGEAERGILLYLRQEGRGIGILEKIKSYALQDKGYDTAEANVMLGHKEDERTYTVASAILKDLGITKVQLLTNNPQKRDELTTSGIIVDKQIPLLVSPNEHNINYLKIKKEKFHHTLPF